MNACLIYVGLGCLFDGYLHFAQLTCLRTFHLSEAPTFQMQLKQKKSLYYVIHFNLPEYVRLNLLVIARGVSML